jgi:hypothetical protein
MSDYADIDDNGCVAVWTRHKGLYVQPVCACAATGSSRMWYSSVESQTAEIQKRMKLQRVDVERAIERGEWDVHTFINHNRPRYLLCSKVTGEPAFFVRADSPYQFRKGGTVVHEGDGDGETDDAGDKSAAVLEVAPRLSLATLWWRVPGARIQLAISQKESGISTAQLPEEVSMEVAPRHLHSRLAREAPSMQRLAKSLERTQRKLVRVAAAAIPTPFWIVSNRSRVYFGFAGTRCFMARAASPSEPARVLTSEEAATMLEPLLLRPLLRERASKLIRILRDEAEDVGMLVPRSMRVLAIDETRDEDPALNVRRRRARNVMDETREDDHALNVRHRRARNVFEDGDLPEHMLLRKADKRKLVLSADDPIGSDLLTWKRRLRRFAIGDGDPYDDLLLRRHRRKALALSDDTLYSEGSSLLRKKRHTLGIDQLPSFDEYLKLPKRRVVNALDEMILQEQLFRTPPRRIAMLLSSPELDQELVLRAKPAVMYEKATEPMQGMDERHRRVLWNHVVGLPGLLFDLTAWTQNFDPPEKRKRHKDTDWRTIERLFVIPETSFYRTVCKDDRKRPCNDQTPFVIEVRIDNVVRMRGVWFERKSLFVQRTWPTNSVTKFVQVRPSNKYAGVSQLSLDDIKLEVQDRNTYCSLIPYIASDKCAGKTSDAGYNSPRPIPYIGEYPEAGFQFWKRGIARDADYVFGPVSNLHAIMAAESPAEYYDTTVKKYKNTCGLFKQYCDFTTTFFNELLAYRIDHYHIPKPSDTSKLIIRSLEANLGYQRLTDHSMWTLSSDVKLQYDRPAFCVHTANAKRFAFEGFTQGSTECTKEAPMNGGGGNKQLGQKPTKQLVQKPTKQLGKKPPPSQKVEVTKAKAENSNGSGKGNDTPTPMRCSTEADQALIKRMNDPLHIVTLSALPKIIERK